jgi:hypothetical protein
MRLKRAVVQATRSRGRKTSPELAIVRDGAA